MQRDRGQFLPVGSDNGLAAAVQRGIAKAGVTAQRASALATFLNAGDSGSATLGLAKACARLVVSRHGEDFAAPAIERVRSISDGRAAASRSHSYVRQPASQVLAAELRSAPPPGATAAALVPAENKSEHPRLNSGTTARGFAAIDAAVSSAPNK
jgi:hypothetical protein